MAFPWETDRSRHKQLCWNDFAIGKAGIQAENPTAEIARCLQHILERFEESEFVKYLVAPSPSSLAAHFKTSLTHIYQALQTLEEKGYGAETSNHYAPILLWDPMVRKNTVRLSHHSSIEKLPQIEITE
jgi:hypothetical protein